MRTATSADVAAALGIGVSTVRKYAATGRIPSSHTAGGHHRYDIDEVRTVLGLPADENESRRVTRAGPYGRRPADMERYGGQWVALRDGEVVCAARSLRALAVAVRDQGIRADVLVPVGPDDLHPGHALP